MIFSHFYMFFGKLNKIVSKIRTSRDNKRLASNFAWLTALQIATYLFPLLTVPYLARVIGAWGYGKIAFASAVMVWVQTVADWGFVMTSTRDVAKCRDNKEEVSRILSETMWARTLLVFVAFVFLLILIFVVPEFRKNYKVLLVTFLMVPGYIMFPDWFFQGMEKMKYTTIVNIIVKIVFTLAVFIFIKKQSDYLLQPLFTSIGYIVAGIVSMFIIIKKWGYRIHFVPFGSIIKAIKRNTDVFLNDVFPNLYNSLSIVILGFTGGPVANGIYNAGFRFFTISQNFLGVFKRVFFPYLSRRIDKHGLFVKLYLGATLLVSLVLFIAAPLIIKIFYTPEFANATIVLRISAVSLVFLSMASAYGSNYLIVEGHVRLLRKVTMWSSLVGFAVAYPLILKFSYIGVAITYLVATVCLGVSSCIAVKRIQQKINKDNNL